MQFHRYETQGWGLAVKSDVSCNGDLTRTWLGVFFRQTRTWLATQTYFFWVMFRVPNGDGSPCLLPLPSWEAGAVSRKVSWPNVYGHAVSGGAKGLEIRILALGSGSSDWDLGLSLKELPTSLMRWLWFLNGLSFCDSCQIFQNSTPVCTTLTLSSLPQMIWVGALILFMLSWRLYLDSALETSKKPWQGMKQG